VQNNITATQPVCVHVYVTDEMLESGMWNLFQLST